jgi:hypothetical protein
MVVAFSHRTSEGCSQLNPTNLPFLFGNPTFLELPVSRISGHTTVSNGMDCFDQPKMGPRRKRLKCRLGARRLHVVDQFLDLGGC